MDRRIDLPASLWVLGVLCVLGFVGGGTAAFQVSAGYWPAWAAGPGFVITASAWAASLVVAVEVALARRAALGKPEREENRVLLHTAGREIR